MHQTLRPFIWRATRLFPDKEIVSRTADGTRHRYTYGDYDGRHAQLANALEAAGVGAGDRVATFAWNHHRHLEAYFAVPDMGAQLHTINPLLPPHHVQHIVGDAQDKLVLVDPALVPALEAAADDPSFASVERYIVLGDAGDVPDGTSLDPVVDYESFVRDHDATYPWPEVDEDQPAGLCYTSGTTGKPRGVAYTHRMQWTHTMGVLIPQGLGIREADAVLPAVPMFHANAWGLPYAMTAAGAKHVYPGPSPTPADIVELIRAEGVTISAGVPTVWLGVLQHLDEAGGDLGDLERIVIGGSAAPPSLIRRYADDHGVSVVHAWGMTETSPVGTVSHLKAKMTGWSDDDRDAKRAKQGLIVPGLEMRVVDDDGGEIPWNGEAFGELLVRGPWVTTSYFGATEDDGAHFTDGWLRTGDVVTVDPEGYVQIVDRAKDVIKSGGEWISSVELENEIMADDAVAEASVIGVPDERWGERPVAFVVTREGAGQEGLKERLIERVRASYPKWWAPDEVVFIDEIPKTATGKFDKKVLRDQHQDPSLVAGKAPEEAAPKG